jgi:tRNA threonylcarbamoyladenosine biosynthesis protein TsaE
MATGKPVTTYLIRSLSDTEVLAKNLLPLLLQRGVVSLEGPLGAGKTHFVKAVALALGIQEEVTSPTFTLLQSYRSATHELHHSDWYRLESAGEAEALGLEEYYDEGLMIIEWGDKFPETLPPDTLRIRIEPQEDESRLVTFVS